MRKGDESPQTPRENGAEGANSQKGFYSCPMFCTRLDEPGTCPVCGMDMEFYADSGASAPQSGEHGDGQGLDQKDPDTVDGRQEDAPWGSEVKLDLKNTVDPVSGEDVGADHGAHYHRVYHGFLIHFASEDTGAKFRRTPIRYLAKLELEPTVDGEVIKVDASSYETPDLPDECPFCGMPLDEEGDIYILHRNFKIFFG